MSPAEHRARILDLTRLVEACADDVDEAVRARREAEEMLEAAKAAYRGEEVQ